MINASLQKKEQKIDQLDPLRNISNTFGYQETYMDMYSRINMVKKKAISFAVYGSTKTCGRNQATWQLLIMWVHHMPVDGGYICTYEVMNT